MILAGVFRKAAKSIVVFCSNEGFERVVPQCVGWEKPFWTSMRRSAVREKSREVMNNGCSIEIEHSFFFFIRLDLVTRDGHSSFQR